MADGGIYKGDSPDSWRLQVNLKRGDRSQLEGLLKALDSDYKIVDKTVGVSEVSQLKINSTELCKDLMQHGVVPKKSQKEVMPELREDLIPHFFRGYFDGDGCLSVQANVKGRRYRAQMSVIGGPPLLTAMMNHFKLNKGLRQLRGAWYLEVTRAQTILDIGETMYKGATQYLERKRARFEELSRITNPTEDMVRPA